MKPRLVTVAHGTRAAEGPVTIHGLVRQVARRMPNVDVVESYVELVEPSFSSVMERAEAPSVVVPLLLSTGYHVTTDLPEAARRSPYPVVTARPLGPHPLLAAAACWSTTAGSAASPSW